MLMRLWYHWLLFLTPFLFTAINDELFEFNKMMFVYVITILVLATWVIWSIRIKKIIWKNHFLLPFAIFFLVSQALSTIFSIHIPTSIFGYYSRFHGGLLSTLAYLVLFQAAISTLSKSDVRPLIRTSLWATLGVVLYALPEHFGVSPSCILITGEANVGCWVQDVQNRIFGTFGQPNWLAAYLIVMIPLGIWYWCTQKNAKSSENTGFFQKVLTAWPVITVSLATAALLFTQSRSGILGLATGLLVFITGMLLHIIQSGQLRSFLKSSENFTSLKPYSGKAFLSALAVSLPILWFGALQWPGLESYILPKPPTPVEVAPQIGTQLDTGGTDSGKIRLIVWQGAVQSWLRSPLLGSGPETFAYSYYLDRPREHNDISEWDFLYNKAHNEFLNFLATTGIVGLGAYLAFMGGFFFLLLREIFSKKSDALTALRASTFLASSTALAVSNFFGFSTVAVAVLFFFMPALWMLSILPKDDRSPAAEKVPDWQAHSGAQWGGILVVLAIALWAFWSVAQTWNNDRLLAVSKAALNANDGQTAYLTAIDLTQRNPNEPGFWEQRSLVMARLAVSIGSTDATTAAQLANDADLSSQKMLELNPRHINFWKSRVRVLLFLGTFDETFLVDAQRTLEQARILAPTDSKLTYNLAVIAQTLGDTETAMKWYDETLQLRPGYEEVRERKQELLNSIESSRSEQKNNE